MLFKRYFSHKTSWWESNLASHFPNLGWGFCADKEWLFKSCSKPKGLWAYLILENDLWWQFFYWSDTKTSYLKWKLDCRQIIERGNANWWKEHQNNWTHPKKWKIHHCNRIRNDYSWRMWVWGLRVFGRELRKRASRMDSPIQMIAERLS